MWRREEFIRLTAARGLATHEYQADDPSDTRAKLGRSADPGVPVQGGSRPARVHHTDAGGECLISAPLAGLPLSFDSFRLRC